MSEFVTVSFIFNHQINTMTEPVVVHNNEENNMTDARGSRNYISLAKQQQLRDAREAKKRKAEEMEEQRKAMTERLANLEGLLAKSLAQPKPKVTNKVQEHSEGEEEEEPEYPPAEPPKKRRRLLNPHRREPVQDYIEPAGWGLWAKVGSLAGFIVFNSVTAALISKYRKAAQVDANGSDIVNSNVHFE